MSRKVWLPAILLGLVALALFGLVSVRPLLTARASQSASGVQAPLEQTTAGTYLWSYAAKFVCGVQAKAAADLVGEPPVTPGNYATEINIHNPNFRPLTLRHKLVVFVNQGTVVARDPTNAQPTAVIPFDLPVDGGTMVDCNRIWQMLNPQVPPPPSPAITIGYLVVFSQLDLDVQAVYTAATPGNITNDSSGISQDVVIVAGKRIFVPTGALP